MEMKIFETLEDLAEFSSEDACYVAYDSMVFDITETLDEMENVSVEDCGKDLTPKFSQEEGDVFYNLNVDNYVSSVLSQLDPSVYELIDDPVAQDIVLDLEETEATVPAITEVDSSDMDYVSMGFLSLLFIAIVVVTAVLVSSFKKGKGQKAEKSK